MGTEYPVPCNPENYLKSRYADWKTENRFYQSRIDDLSISAAGVIGVVPPLVKQHTDIGGKPKKIQLTGKYFDRIKVNTKNKNNSN